ncbi:BMC domain-containing protein [Carboxydothermus ferrireducens]|uniref:Ethanolamine utilization microcompartment shell protein EutS n=1 Tax=Carboxydothermus ferrireducens DSM 11255 TaxID=1119529 RepID=A0ABX2RBF0_9THEO|nr:BMC domain-containing protein [Carboxydothermus ferrireducens]NYE58484.1 ethanolamine utilization microcompartment shell protein EutS [Carboxydothermus ferrireducens DSM 11255]
MKIEIIKSPSIGVREILNRRGSGLRDYVAENPGAIGLVEGNLAEILKAADIAEKSAQVKVEEIRGLCPQHVVLIAISGDVAAVEHAIRAIKGEI